MISSRPRAATPNLAVRWRWPNERQPTRRRHASRSLQMSAPVIEAVGLSRTYHVGDVDVHALQDASLTVERGEFVAIMGSSGSGKSTLMSILGCLDQPSSGQYFF